MEDLRVASHVGGEHPRCSLLARQQLGFCRGQEAADDGNPGADTVDGDDNEGVSESLRFGNSRIAV